MNFINSAKVVMSSRLWEDEVFPFNLPEFDVYAHSKETANFENERRCIENSLKFEELKISQSAPVKKPRLIFETTAFVNEKKEEVQFDTVRQVSTMANHINYLNDLVHQKDQIIDDLRQQVETLTILLKNTTNNS